MKYSISLLKYDKLIKLFKNGNCNQNKFKEFIFDLQTKNKNKYIKLQGQTDMILDYCLLNQNEKAKDYKPIY